MKKGKLIGCGIFVLVPLLLLFGVRAYLSRDLRAAAGEYDQAVAAATKAGLALKIEDALPKPVPEAENASREYRALVAYDNENRKALADALKVLADLAGPGKNVPTTELRTALRKAGPFLAIARRAANKPYCVFERDWSKPYAVMFPEYAVMKQAGRVLIASGWLAVREGRVSDGLTDLGLAMKVSRHAATEPTIISLLVGSALEAMVLSAATQMAAERPALASNQEFRTFVGQPRPLPDLKNAFAGELAFALSIDMGDAEISKMLTGGGPDDGAPSVDRPTGDQMMRYVADPGTLNRAMQTRALQFWTAASAALEGSDPLTVYRAISDLSAEYGRREARGDNLSYRLLGILLPSLEGVAAQPVTMQAQRKLAGLYLDVLAFRSANGGWPLDLSKLRTNATDPWSGRPLIYKVTADGFDLYSVGPNQADDAGGPDDRGFFFPPRSPRSP
ncbi:MAG: hypothetical protein KIS66_03650 [Fimbriimonadaceae bacterium]|nr:hypothetical protein [Fimbriimonadaceae bacterium]